MLIANGALDQLLPALLKAQAAIKPATKASTNPHFKSKYASLPDIWEVVSGPLHENGLLVIQGVGNQDDAGLTVETSVIHAASGQLLTTGVRVPVIAENAQAIGSAISYGRRYGLMTLLAVVSDDSDDDGNLATASAPPARERPAAGDKLYKGVAEMVQIPFGDQKGTKLGTLSDEHLEKLAGWCKAKGKFPDIQQAAEDVLKARQPALVGNGPAPEPPVEGDDELPY
jgi:hypothetical protein